MKIKILGAHSYESANTRLSSILIDDVLAVDAGGLTSSLSFAEQENVEHILLTHGHYDHVRDVPAIALRNQHRTIDVHATQTTLDVLTAQCLRTDVVTHGGEMSTSTRVYLAPNPSAGEVTVQLILSGGTSTELSIYDVTGRRVRELMIGPASAGSHTLTWDGRTDAGETVSPGIYFVQVEWRGGSVTERVVILR